MSLSRNMVLKQRTPEVHSRIMLLHLGYQTVSLECYNSPMSPGELETSKNGGKKYQKTQVIQKNSLKARICSLIFVKNAIYVHGV